MKIINSTIRKIELKKRNNYVKGAIYGINENSWNLIEKLENTAHGAKVANGY